MYYLYFTQNVHIRFLQFLNIVVFSLIFFLFWIALIQLISDSSVLCGLSLTFDFLDLSIVDRDFIDFCHIGFLFSTLVCIYWLMKQHKYCKAWAQPHLTKDQANSKHQRSYCFQFCVFPLIITKLQQLARTMMPNKKAKQIEIQHLASGKIFVG